MFPLHYTNPPAKSVSILSLELDERSILCTSVQPHGFKAKKVCGQLLFNQNPGALSTLCGPALKIMSTPSDYTFTFLRPDKQLQSITLEEVTAQLALGELQVFFGYVTL